MNQEGCPILIRNSFLQQSCEQSCQVTAVGPEGEARQENVSVACEHLLSVYINERPWSWCAVRSCCQSWCWAGC